MATITTIIENQAPQKKMSEAFGTTIFQKAGNLNALHTVKSPETDAFLSRKMK
jgi:hypothetical protein